MTSEFTNFDDLTVDEAKEALADADENDLRDVLTYERSHKDRVTLTRWIEERVGEEPGDEEPDDDNDVPIVRITNGTFTGYAAGIHFENPHERHDVRLNRRIERAIENGKVAKTETQPDQ